MKEFDYGISLRIRHPSIDPHAITKALGFPPEHAWRAGERKPEAGNAAAATYRETYWIGGVRQTAGLLEFIPHLPLDNALMVALLNIKRIEPFWSELLDSGGTARFIIEVSGREDFTLDLSQWTLEMLVRYRIAVSVDVHAELGAAVA